jgi:hypothetical protein
MIEPVPVEHLSSTTPVYWMLLSSLCLLAQIETAMLFLTVSNKQGILCRDNAVYASFSSELSKVPPRGTAHPAHANVCLIGCKI